MRTVGGWLNNWLKFCWLISWEKNLEYLLSVFFFSLSAVKCGACIPVLTLLWLWRDVKAIRLAVHWRLTSTGRGRKKKTQSIPSHWGRHVCNLCQSVHGCAYRRSFLLRRKSFLVCAISASLGRGGKTCWETNHGVRDSCCQDQQYGSLSGKLQQNSSLL